MIDVTPAARSFFSILVDLQVSALGFAFVVAPTVRLGNVLLDSPLDPWATELVVLVVTLAGASAVAAGYWSLRDLVGYLIVLAAVTLGLGGVCLVAVLSLSYPTASVVAFRSAVSDLG